MSLVINPLMEKNTRDTKHISLTVIYLYDTMSRAGSVESQVTSFYLMAAEWVWRTKVSIARATIQVEWTILPVFLVKVTICRTRPVRGTNQHSVAPLALAVRQTRLHTHTHIVGAIGLWYLQVIPLNTCVWYTYVPLRYTHIYVHISYSRRMEDEAFLFPTRYIHECPLIFFPFLLLFIFNSIQLPFPSRFFFGSQRNFLAALKKEFTESSSWDNPLTISVVLRLVQGSWKLTIHTYFGYVGIAKRVQPRVASARVRLARGIPIASRDAPI